MSSRIGRPIAGKEPRNRQIALRATETTKRKFRQCSEITGKTQTDLLEEMINNLYNRLIQQK